MPYLLYHYTPSLPAAAIVLALFFLSTMFHMFQMITNRTWYFVPFVIGGFFEWIGYIGRIESSRQEFGQWTLGPFIIQSLLLLLAPALFAASIYMLLSRIILLTNGEEFSPIKAKRLTKLFVTGDVICFLLQAAGGGILAESKTQSGQSLGQDLITAGLFVQVVAFGLFVITAAVFHVRIVRSPTKVAQSASTPWQSYLNILYVASGLIMIRSILRVIEYIQGNDGYILSHEVFLYIFDSLPMAVTMFLFNIWHPSKIVRGKGKSPSENSDMATERGHRLSSMDV